VKSSSDRKKIINKPFRTFDNTKVLVHHSANLRWSHATIR